MSKMRSGTRVEAMKSQSGVSLVLAVIVLGGVSITAASAVQFPTSNELAAERSIVESEAQVAADAGHNIARATLWDPGTDITNPSAIPLTTAVVDGQTVNYSGSYDSVNEIWTLTGTASANNPNAPGADITRSVSSKVQVSPGATVPDDNTVAAWSSIFVDSWPAGQSCAKVDDDFVIRVEVYIRGDLCMDDDSTIDAQAGKVQVWGNIDVDDDSSVGSAANPIPFLAVGGNTVKWAGNVPDLGQGCRDESPNWSHGDYDPGEFFETPCTAGTSTYATVFSDSPADVTMPPMDLAYWYANAKPGPLYPCTSGSLPPGEEFDDDTTINESASDFELTTTASYDCKYEDPITGELIGRIAWSGGTTGVLTIHGTIFFDGDIHLPRHQG
ncbi:MAG: hypothetical protein ACR2OD_10035, partial [Gaiellaceae bacterium]